jgi:hypothetical protein
MAIIVNSSQNAATPLAVRTFSAAEICEMALRKIGAFAINDEAADQDEMDEALRWLDLILAEVTGTRRCYWLMPATVTFDWPGAEESVVLADQMGADYPPTGVQFPVRAWSVNVTSGLRETELELCRRKTYEAKSDLTTAGSPEILFVDRLVENQKAYIWPVPATDDLYQVAIEFQTYNQSALGTQGGDQAGDVPIGVPKEWQLFVVTRLAAEVGDGPVKRLDTGTIRDWRTLADGYMSALIYANKEKTNRRPVTRRYGG